MRKFFRNFIPSQDVVRNNRWLKPFARWLHHPNLWHLNRRSVAGGVAVGLFCGLIPGPLQMLTAAPLAVLLRVNLPIALVTTLYTNPFTFLPLYALAYELGSWVSGTHNAALLTLPELHWHNWASGLWHWLRLLGKPILIGLPLLAVLLAVMGYCVVRVAWRVAVVLRWRARKNRRLQGIVK
ncbi:MAG: DUF2062 domain-containing protein [Gallionella sp.]|nr:DUF2062 domain-containing protein [Gallionella sp.]